MPLSHAKMSQKSAPQKGNLLMAISIQKRYTSNCNHKALARFHIVMHCYAASFSRKTILCETKNIINSLGNQKLDKTNS